MINSEQLLILKSIWPPQQFSLLIDIYVNDSTRILLECKNAIYYENWQHLAECAFNLQKISTNLCITDIAQFCQDLQSYASENDKNKCFDCYWEILKIHSETIPLLQNYKK